LSRPVVGWNHLDTRVLERGDKAAAGIEPATDGYARGKREMRNMRQQVEETGRDAVLVEDAAWIRVMGIPILEALPSRGAPYDRVDPFILVHEGRFRLSPEMSAKDTKHPHRGFDNLWYVLEGSISTGHNTGPGGAMERARLTEGSLLALRAGRGVWGVGSRTHPLDLEGRQRSLGRHSTQPAKSCFSASAMVRWVRTASRGVKAGVA